MKRRPFVTLTAAVALVLGLGTAGAIAYWTSRGSGSGVATVGALQAVTLVDATGTVPSSKLIPGGSAALALKVNNTNPVNVTLTAIALKSGGSITADGAHSGCTTTGVSLAAATNLPYTLVPGTNVVQLLGGVAMSTASISACQGATFSIDVTITVQT